MIFQRGLYEVKGYGLILRPSQDSGNTCNYFCLCVFLCRRGEQENQVHILRRTVEHRQFLGKGNIRKYIFNFGETGTKPIYIRGPSEQVPLGRASESDCPKLM